MRVLEFGSSLRSSEECGCGFSHDKTLEKVFIGDVEEAIDKLEDLGSEPPYAVFYDDITYRVAGKLIKERLNAIGILVESPTFHEAEAKLAKTRSAKTVLGVGGGTVIDVAKYIAYRLGSSFISVPTAPSHDGIVSPIVSLFMKGRRKSILARSPKIAIIDLSILREAPRELLISGYGDILAKIVSIKDWQLGRDELGEPYCKTVESLILESLTSLIGCLSRRSAEDCLERLVEALVKSGVSMMLVSSSRPASGSEHLISHYLDMHLEKRLRHGIQCAIGAIAMAEYHKMKNPGWWKDEIFQPESIRRYLSSIGAPTTLREAGIPLEVMRRAIVESWRIRPKRYTILHKFRPDYEEALTILRASRLI